MFDSAELSLAAFVGEINRRVTSVPPIRRSPEVLSFALTGVREAPGTMRSRVLGKFLVVGLSRDGGVTFSSSEIFPFDGETLGLAAELIEGRHNGWWPQPEWDVRESIEAMASTAAHPGK